MHISALYIHPIKSAAALACEVLQIEPRGPIGDRRWMLVDDAGRFVSGRELGALVRMQARPLGEGLELQWNDERCTVDVPGERAERLPVQVWDDHFDAALADHATSLWLSERLGRRLRLVHLDTRSRRYADPAYAGDAQPVSLADGYPLLLLSQAAVDELSARARRPLSVRRFRPNIVVDGVPAHAEDGWRRLRIGSVVFDAVKPCTRCVFTTVDPDSGERAADGEPLTSLKHYRRGERGITFGMNLVPRGSGEIACGMPIELLD